MLERVEDFKSNILTPHEYPPEAILCSLIKNLNDMLNSDLKILKSQYMMISHCRVHDTVFIMIFGV